MAATECNYLMKVIPWESVSSLKIGHIIFFKYIKLSLFFFFNLENVFFFSFKQNIHTAEDSVCDGKIIKHLSSILLMYLYLYKIFDFLSLSVFVSLSLSVSLIFSLSLSLIVSHSLSFSLPICSLPPSRSVSLSLSLRLSLPQSEKPYCSLSASAYSGLFEIAGLNTCEYTQDVSVTITSAVCPGIPYTEDVEYDPNSMK